MKIELAPLQEIQLRKEIEKKIIDKIKKEKTSAYYIIRIVWGILIYVSLASFFFGLNYLVDKSLNESVEHDDYYNCWVDDEYGIHSETGENMERHHSVDCDKFIINN